MSKSRGKVSKQEGWAAFGELLQEFTPQLNSILADEEQFISLHVKLRPDRTTLTVLKSYGSDGTPMVCFGSGYGIVGALFGLESSIAANSWREDKPWSG